MEAPRDNPQVGDMWLVKWKSDMTGGSGEKLYLVLDVINPGLYADYVVWSYHRNREEVRDFVDYINEVCAVTHHKVA